MVVFDLFKQQFKQGIRSRGFYKNMIINIIMGLFSLYMAAMLLFIGFFLGDLLTKMDTKLNPVELFNGVMLWLIIIAVLFRFFIQQLNTMNLPAYQMLPIKRSSLINFLILKPLLSPFNYITLLLVIPFAAKTIPLYYNGLVAFQFVINFIFIIWFDSLFAAFLKRKFGPKIWSIFILLGIIAVLGVLEYFQWFSLFNISLIVFNFLIQNIFGSLLLLLLPLGGFLLNKWFFARNYYPESFNKISIKQETTSTASLSFLDRFGIIGDLISVELKMLLRHKRTKSLIYLSVFFLFYGLIFYTNDLYGGRIGMLFFCALFVTGFMMMMYGQWVISWDSTHFDALMTKNIPVRSYINANYYLLAAFNIASFVLTMPYFYFGKHIVYMHIAAFLFNTGISIPVLLYFATFNRKRIELSQANAFNYQGTTFKNFLIIIPILLIPLIIVGILSVIFNDTVALWTIAIIGLLGLCFHKPILNLCVKQFNAQKYNLAQGFREKE
jgi:hypothetical protein